MDQVQYQYIGIDFGGLAEVKLRTGFGIDRHHSL